MGICSWWFQSTMLAVRSLSLSSTTLHMLRILVLVKHLPHCSNVSGGQVCNEMYVSMLLVVLFAKGLRISLQHLQGCCSCFQCLATSSSIGLSTLSLACQRWIFTMLWLFMLITLENLVVWYLAGWGRMHWVQPKSCSCSLTMWCDYMVYHVISCMIMTRNSLHRFGMLYGRLWDARPCLCQHTIHKPTAKLNAITVL